MLTINAVVDINEALNFMIKKPARTPVEKTLYAHFPEEHHHLVAEWILEVSDYDALYMHLDDMVNGVHEKIKKSKIDIMENNRNHTHFKDKQL